MLLRLKKRSQFLKVAATGNKFVTRSMVMQFLRHDETEGTPCVRVGFTVTRKQGGAVERNRIRRRLREVLRLSYNEKALQGWDIVIIGRRAALEYPVEILTQDMRYALSKLARMQTAPAPHDQ